MSMEDAPLATGMALGAHVSGDLIIEATTTDGRFRVRLPHAWLHAEGGVRHFIESECRPQPDQDGKVRGLDS